MSFHNAAAAAAASKDSSVVKRGQVKSRQKALIPSESHFSPEDDWLLPSILYIIILYQGSCTVLSRYLTVQ